MQIYPNLDQFQPSVQQHQQQQQVMQQPQAFALTYNKYTFFI